jgi:hypothetical protein
MASELFSRAEVTSLSFQHSPRSGLATNRVTADRVLHRRERGSFCVVPQEADHTEELYAVFSPTGVALYTFSDIQEAIAEAAELNATHIRAGCHRGRTVDDED